MDDMGSVYKLIDNLTPKDPINLNANTKDWMTMPTSTSCKDTKSTIPFPTPKQPIPKQLIANQEGLMPPCKSHNPI
jgi:hypothetical protein